jgi:hypothetical protein
MRDTGTIVEKSAMLISQFIRQIEERFPKRKHIVLTGGLDSQMILLAPKVDDSKWNVFSAYPNAPIVRKFIKENNIVINEFFEHDNVSDFDENLYNEMAFCGDLYSDPRHIRWMTTMREISNLHANECIFWGGSIADAIFAYHHLYHQNSSEYFDKHMQRAAFFQGAYHQIFRNFVGCPYVSPYHSQVIWDDLIIHLDPDLFAPGVDLRRDIAERLAGRKVAFSEHNPSPAPWNFTSAGSLREIYFNELRTRAQACM